MKIKKRIFSLALVGALTMGLLPAFSFPALAAEVDSSYTLTIPSTLSVANSGWNATDGISATGTLVSGKRLTVTATSAYNWALKSGDNSVGYNLATATGAYSSSATPASWEFTAAELNASGGTNKAMGIIVENYSTKPAGTYTDTVTFTAKVAPASITVTWNNNDITGTYGTSFTKEGVTITADDIEFEDKNFMFGGTFTTTLGNFTKIEVTTGYWNASGTGWSGSGQSGTWTGNASSVSFSGDIVGAGIGNTKFVFTIEPTN